MAVTEYTDPGEHDDEKTEKIYNLYTVACHPVHRLSDRAICRFFGTDTGTA